MSPYSGTITWVIGSNQVTIFWNSAGARWVSVSYTTPDGCTPAAPTVLNVAVSPSPPTPVITLNGNTLVSNAADGNQWYLNNCAIPGAKEQTYIAVYCGDYTDIVTSNGCSSQISNKITVIVSGIVPESAAGQWNIYPNPSQGHFTLSITSGYQEIIDLSILNNLGIPVYNKSGITVNGNHQEVIDLPGLLPGIYPVVLNTADWHSTQKVVIY